MDVSWAPSPAMTLNATINPDFSQVETDQLQLNFNDSFALFYQEKRPFFLEGADYFTTPFQVLYTRQIADPDYGLRVTGRSGRSTSGSTHASCQPVMPSEWSSCWARSRYVFQSATLGWVATVRSTS